MCGPEDPLFTPLLPLARVPFQAKEQFTRPLLRKFGNFSLYSLNFHPNFSSQTPKSGKAHKPPFSAHKPPFSEANVRPHTSECPGRTPLLKKCWVPCIHCPPRNLTSSVIGFIPVFGSSCLGQRFEFEWVFLNPSQRRWTSLLQPSHCTPLFCPSSIKEKSIVPQIKPALPISKMHGEQAYTVWDHLETLLLQSLFLHLHLAPVIWAKDFSLKWIFSESFKMEMIESLTTKKPLITIFLGSYCCAKVARTFNKVQYQSEVTVF